MNIHNWNADTIDKDIKELIGEDLYNHCVEIRGEKFLTKKDGLITYHLTRTACEKVHDYIFNHRDTHLYDAYVGIDGYKMIFHL